MRLTHSVQQMAKRKLSKQQQARVRKQQFAAQSSDYQRRGLVIASFGKRAAIESPADGKITLCDVRQNIGGLVAGDRVTWEQKTDGGLITSLLPRANQLARPDARGQLRAVAANIERAVLVIATRPQPFSNLIDRYLAAIELVGIRPLLVLNKADLIDTASCAAMIALLSTYERIGYEVVRVSASTKAGLDTLRAELSEGNNVFVGQSGVGKSSLINCLCPGADAETSALSDGAVKGRHTTTTARLFHMPGGGSIIDSPGVREFNLWHVDQRQLIDGFIDIRSFAGECQFRNCAHSAEKNCAVRRAYRRGEISESRWRNYQQIRASLQTA